MDVLAFKLRGILAALLNAEQHPSIARFFTLLILGDYGPYAKGWIEPFRHLQLLHLLVLSGSQVQQFRRVAGRLLAPFIRSLIANPQGRRRAFDGVVGLLILFYGFATHWPAPLNRAIIFFLLGLVFPRWNLSVLVVASLAAHLVLFPADAATLSFYLSWTSFLVILFLGERAHFIPMQMFLCVFMFFVLCGFGVTQLGQLATARFFWGVLLSGVMVAVFDAALMPFAALLLCFAMGLVLIPGGWAQAAGAYLGVLFEPALSGLHFLLLVALCPFRYT